MPFTAVALSAHVGEDLFHLPGYLAGAVVMLDYRLVSLTAAIVRVAIDISGARDRPVPPTA